MRTNRPTVQGSLPPQYGRDGARPSRYSPVAGSVCNLPSQRALHSAGRTHLPPQNAEIIPPAPAPRQPPRPPELARGVTAVATCFASSATPRRIRHSAPKRKFRTTFANAMRNRYTSYICSERMYEHLSLSHQRRVAFCWDAEDELRRWLVGHLHITQRNDIHTNQCIAHLQV